MLSKKLILAILAIALAATLIPFAPTVAQAAVDTAALQLVATGNQQHNTSAQDAAEKLHALGLFQGVGDNADGTPNFALDRVPTRHEAVTMLVRLLGKEAETRRGIPTVPFTDVAEWALPYVRYAYAAGLTTGTSETTFGGYETITASQYLTFVLRALGYISGEDFAWDKAWELSDELGLTNGEYNDSTSNFSRGDIAIISFNALRATQKNWGVALFEVLIEDGAISREVADSVGLQKTGYYLDKTEGLLLWRRAPGEEEKIMVDFSDLISYWDFTWMTVTTTAYGNDVVCIHNTHGEPHLWTDFCYVYVSDDKVVAQGINLNSMAGTPFKGVSADGSRVVISDGKTAIVYDDKTLQVIAEYDLPGLCAEACAGIQMFSADTYSDASYDIIAYGENHLLLAGSYHRLLIVVYPESGQADVVYKEILSPEEQEYFEQDYESSFFAVSSVSLWFEREEDGFLIFSVYSMPANSTTERSYQIK